MKTIIAAALVVTAVLCFSTLPLSSEKGTIWCTYGTGSELQSNIQAERGVYFNATDFGLIYPVYLHDIGAYLTDEGYSYTYRVYDQNSDSLIYEGVFPDSSTIGNNIQNINEPLILNRNFTVSMIPESSGLPGLGHTEQTISENSFYKTGGGNWEAFSSDSVRYEWNIYAKMSNVNDYDAPEIISISGLESIKDVDATIAITVRDESAISQVYGEYDLGAGWVQFAMNATKADYIYSGTIPSQPADTSIPVRFYMKDGLNNSGYSSTYTAKWTGGLPINVTISYLDSTVTINWDVVVDAEKYYIYSKDDPNGGFALIDSTIATTWNETYSQSKQFFYVTAEVNRFVLIPGGTFQMGDHFSEGLPEELPVHSVTLNSFYIGKYEVTQSEWAVYMPAATYNNGVGNNYPVYNVNWYSIMKYCNLRSISEGLTPVYTISASTDPTKWGTVPISTNPIWDAVTCNWSANGYRIPTEAEWEYAARGGLSGQRFPNGATISHSTNGDTQANYYASTSYSYDVSPTTGYHPDFGDSTATVGSFNFNGYGLYNVAGNLWESCWDWYSVSYYSSSPNSNPTGPSNGTYRVVRGGFWKNYAADCRVAKRGLGFPGPWENYISVGFRLARTP